MHASMIQVISSNIDGYRYLRNKQQLLITFKSGASYGYEGVPDSVLAEFEAASSKGTYFNQRIKDQFTTTPLDDRDVANLLSGLSGSAQQKRAIRPSSLKLSNLQLKYPLLASMF